MAIRRSITAASKHTSQSKSDRRNVLLSPLQSRPSPQACCAAHMLVAHTCLLCVALPRKPSCRSVCSSKPQLHPNTKTNYITHPSWLAMHDRNQPCGEVTACYLGDLMSCVERSSKLTLTVAAGRWEVRTVTSTRADDSLSTLLFQLSASLPLPPSLSRLSPLSASLSPFTLLSLQRQRAHLLLPISRAPAGLTLSSLDCHTPLVSILSAADSPPSLPRSLPSHSVSHTHICALALTSSISTLFVCLQAHTHMMWPLVETQNSKLCTHPPTSTLIP